ncbi:hypothetical protein GW796_00430 [archaeon]|nr:hypothetical protein [archaeon]
MFLHSDKSNGTSSTFDNGSHFLYTSGRDPYAKTNNESSSFTACLIASIVKFLFHKFILDTLSPKIFCSSCIKKSSSHSM